MFAEINTDLEGACHLRGHPSEDGHGWQGILIAQGKHR